MAHCHGNVFANWEPLGKIHAGDDCSEALVVSIKTRARVSILYIARYHSRPAKKPQ